MTMTTERSESTFGEQAELDVDVGEYLPLCEVRHHTEQIRV